MHDLFAGGLGEELFLEVLERVMPVLEVVDFVGAGLV